MLLDSRQTQVLHLRSSATGAATPYLLAKAEPSKWHRDNVIGNGVDKRATIEMSM